MLALNQALTAEQRLQKAVMSIMAHDKYVGLSSVLMVGDRTVMIPSQPLVPMGVMRCMAERLSMG